MEQRNEAESLMGKSGSLSVDDDDDVDDGDDDDDDDDVDDVDAGEKWFSLCRAKNVEKWGKLVLSFCRSTLSHRICGRPTLDRSGTPEVTARSEIRSKLCFFL